jgi:thiol-disulfide isomerase/thioredoxin
MSGKTFKALALIVSICTLAACNSSVSKEASKASSTNEMLGTKADSKKPTVILFYAQWCGYCKQMFPMFQELQPKYKDRVNFFYIDIDSEKGKALATQYRTKQAGVPDTQFYNAEGKLMEEFLGASPIERIETNIKNLL